MNKAKQKLRTFLKEKYRQLNDETCVTVDQKLIDRLVKLPLYRNCTRIFLYASTAREVNTHALIESAYAQGKTVALPKSGSGGMMDFYEYHGRLTVGRFNIPEPDSELILYPATNDIMIVPGLAFTEGGHRLGYGGGYYDRYLAKHPCVTIGLCRDMFLAKELPVAWNDLPVDYVITETVAIQCKNGASFEAPLD